MILCSHTIHHSYTNSKCHVIDTIWYIMYIGYVYKKIFPLKILVLFILFSFLLYSPWKHFHVPVKWQKTERKHDCFSVSLRPLLKLFFSPLYLVKCINLYNLYFIYLVCVGHDHCLWHFSSQERWKCNSQCQQKLVSCFPEVRGSIPGKAG